MIDPTKIDPAHAAAKLNDLDFRIKQKRDEVKELTAKRAVYAEAIKKN